MIENEEILKKKYFELTANKYDESHSGFTEHVEALTYIVHFYNQLNCKSILDVGAGSGIIIAILKNELPDVRVCGIEPVEALAKVAYSKGIKKDELIIGSGEKLPFKNGEFDFVIETGVLHHVRYPHTIVKEMMRVAKKGVFLSDSNRFGQGNPFLRILKFLLYKTNLWGIANHIKTQGKGYSISEGDGLYYSYSVFDNYYQLSNWGENILAIPTGENIDNSSILSWFSPLLTAPHVLLCSIKKSK